MPATVELKNHKEVTITELLPDDLDDLLEFFQKIPDEDRLFLRMDVTDRNAVVKRMQHTLEGKSHRLVACSDGSVVAYGVLEREGHAWEDHVGEMRLIVGREYQRQGLGMSLARELYQIAVKEEVEVVVARMMAPQSGARRILERLGFVEEVVLRKHVRDRRGRKQDLILMRCDLQTLLAEMQNYFEQSDWQRSR